MEKGCASREVDEADDVVHVGVGRRPTDLIGEFLQRPVRVRPQGRRGRDLLAKVR